MCEDAARPVAREDSLPRLKAGTVLAGGLEAASMYDVSNLYATSNPGPVGVNHRAGRCAQLPLQP